MGGAGRAASRLRGYRRRGAVINVWRRLHFGQHGDSKRADNSDCLGYRGGPKIGNRPRGGRIRAGRPPVGGSLGRCGVARGAPRAVAVVRTAAPRGVKIALACRIGASQGSEYHRHKRVWWTGSLRTPPQWPGFSTDTAHSAAPHPEPHQLRVGEVRRCALVCICRHGCPRQ